MLATLTPQAAAATALKNFCHDLRVSGKSNGVFSIDDLIKELRVITGPAKITPLLERDIILLGNESWSVVIELAADERVQGNPRWFSFSVGNRPLAYLLAIGEEGARAAIAASQNDTTNAV